MKKIVYVTGGARGLGLAISRYLVECGFAVIACSRSCHNDYRDLMEKWPELYRFEMLDMSTLTGMHEWVQDACKRNGLPYGLVNNSALGYDGILGTMHESQINELIQVNLTAPILLTKYMCRKMLSAGEGRVVNISSIIASTGFSGLSVYGATKAGLNGFTKSLAREVGKCGVTVNAIAPGYMETEMTNGLQEEKLQVIKRRSPLGRLASVDDVAALVTHLMGPHGGGITGSIFTVDAGSTA